MTFQSLSVHVIRVLLIIEDFILKGILSLNKKKSTVVKI